MADKLPEEETSPVDPTKDPLAGAIDDPGHAHARHPLVFFFIIAYAFSWLAWLPLVLSEDGVGLLSFRSPIGFYATLAIASFGPALAAFIMTGITEGRIGIGRLLRRIVLWRVGLRWYLFALIGLPAIMVLSVILVRLRAYHKMVLR
jgi:uncharacterized protein